jgi:hypothetical protein
MRDWMGLVLIWLVTVLICGVLVFATFLSTIPLPI